jgi:hypothetical protein
VNRPLLSYFRRDQILVSFKPSGVAVKIRKSTTLVAGACTLCIAAASGTVEPQVELAAKEENTPRVVSREYTLAAAFDPIAIAQLPFQNYFTIASTLGSLAAFVPPVNQATGAFFQGNWSAIPPLLQKAVTDEIAAIQNVIKLPATIITYDLGVIFGGTTMATLGSAAATPTAVVAPADATSGLLAIAQLPFQNYFTIASTLGSLAAFVPPVNQATGAFFQGNWSAIPPLLEKAFNDELAAINNVLKLPATIIANDLAVIGGAFGGGSDATALTTGKSSIEMQALTAALNTDATTNNGTDTSDKKATGTTNASTNNDTDANDKNGSGTTNTETTKTETTKTETETDHGKTGTGTGANDKNEKSGSGANDKKDANGAGADDATTTKTGASTTKSASTGKSGEGANDNTAAGTDAK